MFDGEKIKIKSDYGKYNIDNNDTIFSASNSNNYYNKFQYIAWLCVISIYCIIKYSS